jgi:hypothetical protein
MDAARGNGPVREAPAGRIVVVIPTLDEEQSIAEVVRSIPRAIVSRVIVAEGGSSVRSFTGCGTRICLLAPRAFWRRPLSVGTYPPVMT